MREFSLIIFLTVSSIYYGSAREIPNDNARAVGIMLGNLPASYSCDCKPFNQCYSEIFVAAITCAVRESCCLSSAPENEIVGNSYVDIPDTLPPPIGVYIDKTPPNFSCDCQIYDNCPSKIYVRNVACERPYDRCCLQVGKRLPLIDFPETYRRMFGIEDYSHIHFLT